MTNVKISELPAATLPLSDAEIAVLVQSGVTKKVSISNFGSASLATHVAASDPHTVYALTSSISGTVAQYFDTHTAAANPHTQYVLTSSLPINNFLAVTSPTGSNDSTQGYTAGSLWIDVSGSLAWTCQSAAAGAANWIMMGSRASLLWKPSGGGDAATWADVMAAVEATPAPITINLVNGETYSIPARAEFYSMKNAMFRSPLGISNIVDIADGATLLDCAGGEGAGVFVGHPTTLARPTFDFSAFHPPLLGTGAPGIFLSQFGGAYLKQLGTSPMIVVPDNGFMVFAQRYGGGIESGSTPGQEVIRVGVNVILLTSMIGLPTQFFLNNITGPASANIIVQNDGAALAPPSGSLPNFFGNLINAPFGNAGGAGPTSFRPAAAFGPLLDGVSYWDTTIQKALWWDAVALVWRDSQGAVVP